MRLPGRLRARVHGARPDAGMTLVELIVSIGIFTIVVSVFMAGVVIMTNNTVRSDVTAQSGDSVRLVFQRLDRKVRYAEAINLPGAGAGGARYVEFRTSARSSGSGVATCTQWRWDPTTRLVQQRTWNDVSGAVAPGWSTLVTDVLPDSDTSGRGYPFEVLLADDVTPHQRLVLRLTVGSENADVTVDSETSFVARNSTSTSLSNADEDGDGVSDTPVCLAASGRP